MVVIDLDKRRHSLGGTSQEESELLGTFHLYGSKEDGVNHLSAENVSIGEADAYRYLMDAVWMHLQDPVAVVAMTDIKSSRILQCERMTTEEALDILIERLTEIREEEKTDG